MSAHMRSLTSAFAVHTQRALWLRKGQTKIRHKHYTLSSLMIAVSYCRQSMQTLDRMRATQASNSTILTIFDILKTYLSLYCCYMKNTLQNRDNKMSLSGKYSQNKFCKMITCLCRNCDFKIMLMPYDK